MPMTKYVTVESHGKLMPLGGILGPITSPCHIDIDVIVTLINAGKVVYEVNPKNIKEKVRLTRMNVLNNNFPYIRTFDSEKDVNVIKASDVGLTHTHISASSISTGIIQDNIAVTEDAFSSNKYN